MSIQRWNLNHYPQWPTAWEAHEAGDWVTYADHVAEVDRAHNCDERACAVADRMRAEGVQDMRAACIAAVKALPTADSQPYKIAMEIMQARALVALREVQP